MNIPLKTMGFGHYKNENCTNPIHSVLTATVNI